MYNIPAPQGFQQVQPMREAFSLGELAQAQSVRNQQAQQESQMAQRMAQQQAEQAKADEEMNFNKSLGTALSGGGDIDEVMKANPERFQQIREAMTANEGFSNQAVGQMSAKVAYAAENGHADVVKSELERGRSAFEQQGNKFAVDTIDKQLALLGSDDPDALSKVAKSAKGFYAIADAKGYDARQKTALTEAETASKVGEEKRAEGMAETEKLSKQANTAKVLADIGLSEAKISELPSGTQKHINESSQSYEAKSTTGQDAKDILSLMDKIDRSTGLYGKGKRYLSQLIGTGSDEEILATRLESLVNAKIMGERKPGEGPMTDSDYKAKRATAPSIDASPKEWGDYLTRLEKSSHEDAIKEKIKMQFLSGNKHLGANTNENLVIDGKKVPTGSTAVEFIKNSKDLWEYKKKLTYDPSTGTFK
jgi:hypothetical protein